jgi:dUTP pyrophosphatase
MKIGIKLDEDAIMPKRAHKTDGGYDLFSREDKKVPAHGSAVFDTGVHIELPTNPLTVGFLKSKSGLNIHHNITSDGTIDAGYSGSIRVKLYNHGKLDYAVNKGDKISQLVIVPIFTPDLEEVGSFRPSERGDNGFGSSGK